MGSRIEWLHRPGTKPEVWNPVTGCTKVSEGCRNCYAERQAARFWPTQYPAEGRAFTDVWPHPDRLDAPLRWRSPRTVFVNSMSDLFHDAVPDAFIDRVFAVMALAPQHTFIVLTKRPERMRAWMSKNPSVSRAIADVVAGSGKVAIDAMNRAADLNYDRARFGFVEPWPLPNVWLGVSVEDQRTADQRIPLLLQTPAAVRVVSAEPLLGPVDLNDDDGPNGTGGRFNVLEMGIDWLIVGGESGPKARPCDVAWVRLIVQQGKAAGVPVFVKQLGANPVVTDDTCSLERAIREGGYTMRDHKGSDPSEWPEDLRIREWPSA